MNLDENDDIGAASGEHLRKKIKSFSTVENQMTRRDNLTPAIYFLFMTKKPLPFIEMSRLMSCDRSSCLAK